MFTEGFGLRDGHFGARPGLGVIRTGYDRVDYDSERYALSI